MEKHYEKILEFEGKKFKIKKLDPFTFSAFKVTYSKALMGDDPEVLGKQNKILLSWILEADTGVPIYDKDTDTMILESLKDFEKTIMLIELVTTEIIAPLFQDTTR